MTTFTVTAGTDHLTRLSKATPLAALSELIWNGLDADATTVSVVFVDSKLDQIQEIAIRDDGHGLHRDDAEARFAQLGGSWKKSKRVSDGGRFLHGSEGKGRFKALSLGRIATWNIVFKDSVEFSRYRIELRADIPNKIEVTASEKADAGAKAGVLVRVEEVGKAKSTFTDEDAIKGVCQDFCVLSHTLPPGQGRTYGEEEPRAVLGRTA